MSDSVEIKDPSVYELSDDAFLNAPLDELSLDESAEESSEVEEVEDDAVTDDEDNPDADDETEDTVDVSETETENQEETDDTSDEAEDETDAVESSSDEDTDTRDYKKEIEELFKPFKANGREVQVNSIAEATQLMQMGANYAKKMAALKPSLKVVKMLENNNLLDEAKLNHLIDISKKDKGAIQKLLTESGIDPLDLDSDANKSYTPNNHSVSDADLTLASTLEDIKETPTYQATVETITKWDDTSRQELVKHPEVIKIINEHMANGAYDRVTTEIERRRMLGQLPSGIPDLALYKQVGDELYGQVEPNGSNTPERSKEIIKPSEVAKPKVTSSKKKIASTPNKGKAKQPASAAINPLLMSDEDFEKSVNMQHLF